MASCSQVNDIKECRTAAGNVKASFDTPEPLSTYVNSTQALVIHIPIFVL